MCTLHRAMHAASGPMPPPYGVVAALSHCPYTNSNCHSPIQSKVGRHNPTPLNMVLHYYMLPMPGTLVSSCLCIFWRRLVANVILGRPLRKPLFKVG